MLIEARKPTRTALPCSRAGRSTRRRGKDRGVVVEPSLLPPYPTIVRVVPPDEQPAARLGETVRLEGHHLDGTSAVVRFAHRLLDAPNEVVDRREHRPGRDRRPAAVRRRRPSRTGPPASTSSTVSLIRPGEVDPRESNVAAMLLAPEPQLPPTTVTRDATTRRVTVTLDVTPRGAARAGRAAHARRRQRRSPRRTRRRPRRSRSSSATSRRARSGCGSRSTASRACSSTGRRSRRPSIRRSRWRCRHDGGRRRTRADRRRARADARSSRELELVRALLRGLRRRSFGSPRRARGSRRDSSRRSTASRGSSGCRAFERQLLLLAAAVELDGEIAALVGDAAERATTRGRRSGSRSPRCPASHWDALAPLSPLRRWRLLEPGAGATLATRPLAIDERILHYLTGSTRPTSVSTASCAPTTERRSLAPSQERLADELAATARAAGLARSSCSSTATTWTRASASRSASRGRSVARPSSCARLRCRRRPGARRRRRASSTARRCSSTACRSSTQKARYRQSSPAFLDELEAPLVVLLGEWPGAARRSRGAAPRRPAAVARRSARALDRRARRAGRARARHRRRRARAALPARRGRDRRGCARAARRARAPTRTTLRRLCRERARVGLEGLAERIEPVARWDDLVLPDGQLELLHEIVRHVRHRTQVYERWGFGERTAARPRRHRAVRRRERHRQDAGRRGARGASSGSTSTASTSPRP